MVIYSNLESNTLAIIFRPYVDPAAIGRLEKATEKDMSPTEFWAYDVIDGEFTLRRVDITLNNGSKHPLRVVSAALKLYLKTEKLLMNFLVSAELPFENLIVAGMSGGGIYAQMFAARAHFLPIPKINHFVRKQVYAFNSPPHWFDDDASSQAIDQIQQEWLY